MCVYVCERKKDKEREKMREDVDFCVLCVCVSV